MIVRFNESIVYDLDSGKVLSPEGSRQKTLLPFNHAISIKKLKPTAKFIKKIGDSWVTTQKLSLAFLIVTYMLRNNKKQLAGFFTYGDGGYVFIEVSLNNLQVTASFEVIHEAPAQYLQIEGKYYDGIFGDPSVRNTEINLNKLKKEFSASATPLQMVVVALVAAGFAVVLLWATGFIGVKQLAVMSGTKEQGPPPLTAAETQRLSVLVSAESLALLNREIAGMNPDSGLKSATVTVTPGKTDVQGSVALTAVSYFPFLGMRREGDLFAKADTLNVTKTRENLSELDTILGSGEGCLELLVDKGEVQERALSEWRFTVTLDRYAVAAAFLNRIYHCPVMIKSMSMDEEKAVLELSFFPEMHEDGRVK